MSRSLIARLLLAGTAVAALLPCPGCDTPARTYSGVTSTGTSGYSTYTYQPPTYRYRYYPVQPYQRQYKFKVISPYSGRGGSSHHGRSHHGHSGRKH
ncbi:MAG: hypothetical protein FJ291_19385 [Planctomycetes bacterium]|nr:hypothetical protein [Planctomycetota bacterium]